MRITSKGQVTVPQHIRERLGLVPNTEVEFTLDGDAVRLTKARRPSAPTRAGRHIARMRGTLKTGMTTDELMKLLRD